MNCPTNTEWVRYAAGDLAPRRRRALDAHLASCNACRRDAAGLERGLAALRQLEPAALRPQALQTLRTRLGQARRPPAVIRMLWQHRWAAAAAAVFLLAFGAWTLVPPASLDSRPPAWVTDIHMQEELAEIMAEVEILEAAANPKPPEPVAPRPNASSADPSVEEIDRFIESLQAEMEA